MAQAKNGLWELQVDMPLLLMPVEQCYDEDEPFRRYKQLIQVFSQRARVNIQLVATVEAMPDFLQVQKRPPPPPPPPPHILFLNPSLLLKHVQQFFCHLPLRVIHSHVLLCFPSLSFCFASSGLVTDIVEI
jgi:hypothetical protein